MEQKLTLTLLLVGCLVVSGTAQCTDQINGCFTTNNFEPTEYDGFPVLLDVPGLRDRFCERIQNFTTCIDEFRTDCTDFGHWTSYSAFENMGQFMCTEEGREAYDEHYVVISNDTYRDEWEVCAGPINDLVSDEPSACSIMGAAVDCHVFAITEESADAQTFVRDFCNAGVEQYYTHYGCSGSSTVGITSSLMIMTLFAFLWSTFH